MPRLPSLPVSVFSAIFCLQTAALSHAAPNDWPGWRSADRTGVSQESGLLPTWPEGGPKILWNAKGLGNGFSSPAVVGNRIYVMGSIGKEETILSLDTANGKQLWSTKVGPVAKDGPPSYPGPRCTPTIDGDRLYALGSDGDLVCTDLGGKVIWTKNLDKDLAGKRGRWAYSESPLIDGDKLICTPGGKKNSLAALDKKTGNTIWTAEVPEGGEAAYASIIAVNSAGVRQYVQYLRNGVASVAAKDGKFLWLYGKGASGTNCSTPIFHDGFVFESDAGPSGGGCALLQLNGEGAGVTAKEVYFNKNLMNHHGGVVRLGDYLYGTTGNVLACIDFRTGEKKWDNRSVGKGAISAADGHLYVRGEKDGAVALVEATSTGYKETGRLQQPDRGKRPAWPHPVIADGRLYLRDDDVLLCYDIKK